MRTFIIDGRWSYARPDYSLWEILPEPKFKGMDYHPDQLWRSIKLPREDMKLFEIINFIHERNPELEFHKLVETIDDSRTYQFWGYDENGV